LRVFNCIIQNTTIKLKLEVPMKKREIQKAIKTVYGELWDLLSLYEVTESYNTIPVESDQGVWEYLGNRLLNIRKSVHLLFLGQKTVTEKLIRIVDETEHFIRSYEQPGVVTRWKQINIRLLYFDCAFEIIEEEPETYKALSRGLTDCRLYCYPDEELVEDRKAYFQAIEEKNNHDNLHYTKERIFQNELLNTLTILFETDFKELLVS